MVPQFLEQADDKSRILLDSRMIQSKSKIKAKFSS